MLQRPFTAQNAFFPSINRIHLHYSTLFSFLGVYVDSYFGRCLNSARFPSNFAGYLTLRRYATFPAFSKVNPACLYFLVRNIKGILNKVYS